MTGRSFYEILEVDRMATQEAIKKSYTNLILKNHPDKDSETKNSSKFIEIDTAYKTLRDPLRRREYDAELFQKQSSHLIIHDTVKSRDFLLDPESNERYFECKCGGFYLLPEKYDENEANSETIIYCDECSLAIKVVN
jgi:diphthamide biosynthesis protein 4